ncbi:Protein CBG14239 [Caenorhabditis briggsae]|uniref:Protein CBG14239 n=1 Tax=Caenorhabditis briggsae TaxID=6238 RepID=A8XJK7_CAEBR|nr:Protein CBG14239 [Caenorhabditis briggsae]CAP32833.2 Protein CBG14239 [Caenorhabditis briggsae]
MRHLLLLTLVSTVAAKNVFVSSPFDNFRIECPKRAAATELSVRMVESVGQKRQDVVFDMSCETVEDLYPWINIPVGVSDIEREDCHYSQMIDPILDENTTFTCAPREYLAGITRLSDTRIQTMCCRLRSRDEFNCKDLVFNKPIGLTRSTVIEHDNQLIHAIRIEERNYVVRFCDLAPRATASILSDEKIRSSTPAATTEETPVSQELNENLESEQKLQQKQDPLKIVKQQKGSFESASPTKLRVPMHPPARVKAAPVVEFQEPALPLVELPLDAADISEADLEPLPTLPPVTTRRPSTVSLALVTLPPTTTTTEEVPVEQELPVTEEPIPDEETTFPQETPVFSQQLVEDIVKKIGSAQSEQKAAQIFQQSLNKLLQNANEKPIGMRKPVPRAGPPAARPPTPQNLENVNFENEQFPQPAGKQRFSKELLPLRKSVDGEDFSNLQPVNMEGRRRSPIRTHRPHVDIWDSDEDDEATDKIVAEINGSVEMHFETTMPPKKVGCLVRMIRLKLKMFFASFFFQIVKKIIKKVIRAHRPRTTTTETPTTTEEPSTTEEVTTTRVTRLRTRPTTTTEEPTTKKCRVLSSVLWSRETDPLEDNMQLQSMIFKKSIEKSKSHFKSKSKSPRRFRGRTTTPSARRDLPVTRRIAETRANQQDNARYIDEETQLSPFDDPVDEMEELKTTTKQPAPSERKKPVEESPRIEFQEDEELEDVISKLSARRGDIRRAPVRNSFAEAQFADKVSLPQKDGVKTHIPRNGLPIAMDNMDMMETISMTNLDGFDSETSKSDNAGQNQKHDEKSSERTGGSQEEEEEESEMIEIDNQIPVTTPTRATRPTTTAYDPNAFYHTPRPRPAKKESILRFCSKDSAIRDQSNMVIACGLDQDIWTPSRCPENADCFPSHDSLYRICCPVHRAG